MSLRGRLGLKLLEAGMKLLDLRRNARAAVLAVVISEEEGTEEAEGAVDEAAVNLVRSWRDPPEEGRG